MFLCCPFDESIVSEFSFLFDNLTTVEILPLIQCKISKKYTTMVQQF